MRRLHDVNLWKGVPHRFLSLLLWYIDTRGER